ncbi:MAG: MarR family transcriptional regulator [Nocardioidaceae bacterium]|nr:MarR family transcriptional regulator [Nocardioidaceae bacterium]MCL2613449.1 MarR family transcriptional regulator [Nocardioidaceae bacterium]
MSPVTTTLSSDLAMYAARVVRLIRQENAQTAGVRALSMIDEHGPLGVTALAQLDNCSQPTMTGIVRQLRDQGWVARQPHPSDARIGLIALTDEGRAELARVRRANGELIASRIDRHPEHSAEDLATAVAVLRDVLAAPTDPEE